MRHRTKGWILLGFTSLLYVYDFVLRVSPGVLATPMMAAFHLNPWQWAWINGMFYYGYAVMQIPSGALVDRYGVKKPLVWGSLLSALCLSVSLFTHQPWALALSRLLMGMAASFAYVGPLMIASKYLPLEHFALAGGVIQILGCFGAVVGTQWILALFHALDLSTTWTVMVGSGLLMTALFMIFIPEDSMRAPPSAGDTRYSIFKKVTTQPINYLIGFLALCLWGPAVIFLESWGMAWLEHIGYPPKEAGRILALGWILIAMAGPLAGWLSVQWHSRKKLVLLGLMLNIVGTVLWMLAYYAPYLAYVGVVLCAMGSATQCVSFGIVADLEPTEHLGVAVGFNNMAIVCSGFTLLPFVGYCLHWSHPAPPDTIHFIAGIGALALVMLIALLLAQRYLPESFHKTLPSEHPPLP